jgi:hypothetical protein
MLSVTYSPYVEYQYAKRRYAECRGAVLLFMTHRQRITATHLPKHPFKCCEFVKNQILKKKKCDRH